MTKDRTFILIALFVPVIVGILACSEQQKYKDDRFISYIVDARSHDIRFYWKDDKAEHFKSIQKLKSWLDKRHRNLVFAMNAGMYKPDNSPQGLFIEDQKTQSPPDTSSGNGNFYLKPNGVFYISVDNSPVICMTTDFIDNGRIKFATQSGPMLVIDGKIHPAFRNGSTNLNIRNGVGILPDSTVIFAMSKKEINFYDFASYFKQLGCSNALYLDGLVSRAYVPGQNWIQTDGNFGVIIGVTENT